MTVFSIDVYCDMACPWSYVGKAYLDKAMETWRTSHPDDGFEVMWKPFYLNLTPRTSAHERKLVYATAMGAERAARFFKAIEAATATLGLDFSWAGKTGSTRPSHRLIRLARARDQRPPAESPSHQDRLVSAMFRGQFTDRRNVSDPAFLTEVGLAAGLVHSADEVLAYLADEAVIAAVDADEQTARRMGISASPSYVIQGRYLLGGCQESPVFLDLFDKITSAAASDTAAAATTTVAAAATTATAAAASDAASAAASDATAATTATAAATDEPNGHAAHEDESPGHDKMDVDNKDEDGESGARE